MMFSGYFLYFQGNRVAPVTEFSMKLIPPRLIPLVENHLKDLKKRGQVSSFFMVTIKKKTIA